jgi:hypothetical protein
MTPKNEITASGIRLFTTVVKGLIHQHFAIERKRKTVEELLDGCEERLQKLEIDKKLKAQKNAASKNLHGGWETDMDAIERAKKMPPKGWVLYGFIPEGSVCNIQSPEKVGKSAIAKQIAYDYSSGTNSMCLPGADNYAASHNEAFIYDAELSDEDILERYEKRGDTKVKRWKDAYFETADSLTENIRTDISTINANTLVILDNVTLICPKFTKTDIDKVRVEFKALQNDFCARGYRLTIILIHHTKANKKGGETDDRAGSVEWGRVGKLNLTFLPCYLGEQYRVLKVINSRGKNDLLSRGEVVVLRIEEQPFFHFVFDRKAKEVDVINKKSRSKPSDDGHPVIDWKLSEEEANYVCDSYQPGKVGYGTLAKDILHKRGIENYDKDDVNHMKNSVMRVLKAKGLILETS